MVMIRDIQKQQHKSRKLALVYKGKGKLIERIRFHGEHPIMRRVIHDPNTLYPIDRPLSSLTRSYQAFNQLQKAVEMHE